VDGQNYLEIPFQKLQTFGKIKQIGNQYIMRKLPPLSISKHKSYNDKIYLIIKREIGTARLYIRT
jgi:hypothetical protein